MLSALLAPVSMLAADMRMGKLGGLCSANSSLKASPASQSAGEGGADSQTGAHCGLCGSVALAPPPLFSQPPAGLPASSQLAAYGNGVVAPAAVPGLPPSRGPPSHI